MSTSSASRSLHLVDLENLIGDPHTATTTALATFDTYLEVARWRTGDHVIVATNPWLMARIAFDLPESASRHAAHGPDGADLMLLALAPPELVAKRYGRLVIGSGDGIFAARAQAASDVGVAVEVVARAGSCSTRLRRFDHSFLTPVSPDVVLAA